MQLGMSCCLTVLSQPVSQVQVRENNDNGLKSQGGVNLLRGWSATQNSTVEKSKKLALRKKLYIMRFLETSNSTIKIECTVPLTLAVALE